MENHQNNLWSLSAQKYFRIKEPEIIKKILNGFLPGRANRNSIRLHVIGGLLKRLYSVCVCNLHLAALHIDEEVSYISYEAFTVELLAYLDRHVVCFEMFQENFADVCR